MSERPSSRDGLLRVVDEIQQERDGIYAMTVNPRRNARRALACLDEGRIEDIRWYLEEVKSGLDAIARDYDRWCSR